MGTRMFDIESIVGSLYVSPMPKIYSPQEVFRGEFPSGIEQMQEAAAGACQPMRQAHKKGDVVAASSYGSLYNEEGQFNRTSDIDWLIVFESLERMMDSMEYTDMQRLLREARIPFGSTVLSFESVECCNHLIGPLLHGIRRSVRRVIVGEDPVELFRRHGTKKNSREILSHMFASYPRYFFESIPGNVHHAQEDGEILAGLLQRAIDYFIDTYRSMIVLQAHEDDFSTPLSFDTYSALYKEEIPPSSMECGRRVQTFIQLYKERMRDTMSHSAKGDEPEKEDGAAEYGSFLRGYLPIVKDSVLFCQTNIECFRQMPPVCSRKT